MNVQLRNKVFPAGAGRQEYRVIEISGDHLLDDLCRIILSLFDFIYDFYTNFEWIFAR